MFLPMLAVQLRRRRRLPDEASQATSLIAAPDPAPTPAHTPDAALTPPESPDPSAVDVPMGTRYQLFRALRAMAGGQCMLVEHKIPALNEHVASEHKRSELFKSLRNTANWCGEQDIEAVMVPGTGYPLVIGRILIRAGWCAPSDRPHWVPNLRFFFLTDRGRESFLKAQAWWEELTALERLQLMLLE